MTYCQEERFGACLHTTFCYCARCGISLCYLHSYYSRGQYLCYNCCQSISGADEIKICYICGKQEPDLDDIPFMFHKELELVVCEQCGKYVCIDHLGESHEGYDKSPLSTDTLLCANCAPPAKSTQ